MTKDEGKRKKDDASSGDFNEKEAEFLADSGDKEKKVQKKQKDKKKKKMSLLDQWKEKIDSWKEPEKRYRIYCKYMGVCESYGSSKCKYCKFNSVKDYFKPSRDAVRAKKKEISGVWD